MKFLKKNKRRQRYGTVTPPKADPKKREKFLEAMRNTGTDFDPEDLKEVRSKK